LMADMNDDVQSPTIQTLLRSVGLADSPMAQHHSPPATHNRGSYPIDGIFLPITLVDQCRTGYLEFGKAVPSNHRAVWLDIPVQYVCPVNKDAIKWPLAQQLHCKDPRVVTKYNKLLWKSLHANGLAWRANNLTQQVKIRLSKSQQEEYESINRAATKYKHNAENNCRKIKARVVPCCPHVSKAINWILYWKGLQSQLKGCAIGC